MSDDKLSQDVKNALASLGNKAYDDLAHPSASQVGSLLEGTLKLVALPFKCLGMTADQLEKRYAEFIANAFNKVPPDKLVKPKTSVAVPLLEQVKYAFEEKELLQMFQSLLASSSNKDTYESMHPSFVVILSQLDSFDANILKLLFDTYIGQSNITYSIMRFQTSNPEAEIFNEKTGEKKGAIFSDSLLKGVTVLNSKYELPIEKTDISIERLILLGLLKLELVDSIEHNVLSDYISCQNRLNQLDQVVDFFDPIDPKEYPYYTELIKEGQKEDELLKNKQNSPEDDIVLVQNIPFLRNEVSMYIENKLSGFSADNRISAILSNRSYLDFTSIGAKFMYCCMDK